MTNPPNKFPTFINQIFVKDRVSNRNFLIDTGADVCVLPRDKESSEKLTSRELYAANGTVIKTYGEKRLKLNLGLRRDFEWLFIIADVDTPIIGNDFLKEFELLVDAHNNRILDGRTSLSTTISSKQMPDQTGVASIKTILATNQFSELLRRFQPITQLNSFAEPNAGTVHHIETSKGPPVSARPRRLAPDKLEAAKAEFQYLMKMGICQPSKSPWSSPLHMVPKSDGSWRPCGDYRQLNKRTLPDRYPLPFLTDCTHILHGKSIFSKVDLQRAYNQVPVHPDDICKTAITTPFGLFEFNKMMFGLCNAAQTMQRLMNSILMDLPYVFVYLDDLLIASNTHQEHLVHLETVFQRLLDNGLAIKPEKCVFGKTTLDFLGYSISKEGIQPLASKVEALSRVLPPQTNKQLRGFVASLNFYKRFIKHAAESQRILTALVDGNIRNDKRPVAWTEEAKLAFVKCKQQLQNAAILAYPKSNATLSLQVDASDFAVGAVLNQLTGDHQQPLGFYSKSLTDAQRRYSAYDRELTAIYQAVLHFKDMLSGRDFSIYTDHKPLVFAFNQNPDKASPRQSRYLNIIGQYSTDIRHIAGIENVTADMLSRVANINSTVSFEQLAEAQKNDEETQRLLRTKSHSLKPTACATTDGLTLICDTSLPN